MTVARRKAAHAKRDAGKADINPHDALVLLTADHNEIDKLVREFERRRKTADHVEKGKLALRICHALTVACRDQEGGLLSGRRGGARGRGQGAAGQGADRT